MKALKGRQCTAGGAALAEPPDHRFPRILALKGRQKRTCQNGMRLPCEGQGRRSNFSPERATEKNMPIAAVAHGLRYHEGNVSGGLNV